VYALIYVSIAMSCLPCLFIAVGCGQTLAKTQDALDKQKNKAHKAAQAQEVETERRAKVKAEKDESEKQQRKGRQEAKQAREAEENATAGNSTVFLEARAPN
jgi:hypothetical protein